jgi:hypothetical protein
LGKIRLEMGKYLCLDAGLAEQIRMTPVDFTVAAHGGLGVRSKGTGAWSECSRCMHGHAGAEEEWLGGLEWPRAKLVKWAAGPKEFLFHIINVFSNLHQKLPAQKYKI